MTINTSSPLDNAAQVDTQKSTARRAHHHSSPDNGTASSAETPATEALNAFSSVEAEGTSGLDATGADQLMQGLLQNMTGATNSAVAAHSGLNAASVFNLLQQI